MRHGIHRIEIVCHDSDGGTEILASEDIESSLRKAKRRCEQMAKSIPYPPSAHRSRGIVYMPDGSRYQRVLRLDTLTWHSPDREVV